MIHEQVIADLKNRSAIGFVKYNRGLEPFYNRHKTGDSAALQDLYEELLDAAQYCKQRLVEEDLLLDAAKKICGAKQSGDLTTLLKEIDKLQKILDNL